MLRYSLGGAVIFTSLQTHIRPLMVYLFSLSIVPCALLITNEKDSYELLCNT